MNSRILRLTIAVLLAAIAACGDDDDAAPPDREIPLTTIEGPVTAGNGIVLIGTSFDLADVGYREDEYFVSGTASAFTSREPLTTDGFWDVEEVSQADYKTRIVVRRPIDDADFNGIVFVEWLNVTAGFDTGPDWIFAHVELIRRGYAYVAVSAQRVGIEGSDDGGGLIPGLNFALKPADPERYGSLVHPGDSYSYDIYSQIGRAMLERNGVDPLDGLVADYVIAAGESQSAFRMTSFINGFAHNAIFDGYLVHSRGGTAASLSQEPLEAIDAPSGTRIRTDLEVPVMTFQAETDVFELESWRSRQPDTPNIRLWEAAGTAHADTYTLITGMPDVGGDPVVADIIVTADPIPGIVSCGSPINSGPHHFLLKAGVRALEHWITDGVEPPTAPLIEITDGDPPDRVFGEYGNVLGGIRHPYVDVPVARLLGSPPDGDGFCFLFGQTIPFAQETLDELYPDHQTYVDMVRASTQDTVDAGFLLPEDAELIIQSAENSDIGR